jgi:hypothetical protein
MQHLIADFDAGPKSASGKFRRIGNGKTPGCRHLEATKGHRLQRHLHFGGGTATLSAPRAIETCPQDWKFWVRSGSNKPAKEFP